MARVAGVDLPKSKRMEIALTYVYGIGRSSSREILTKAGISLDLKSDDLSDDDVAKIRQVLEQGYKVEGDLRREVTANIKRHLDMGSYRGQRHRKNCRCAASAPIRQRGEKSHGSRLTKRANLCPGSGGRARIGAARPPVSGDQHQLDQRRYADPA